MTGVPSGDGAVAGGVLARSGGGGRTGGFVFAIEAQCYGGTCQAPRGFQRLLAALELRAPKMTRGPAKAGLKTVLRFKVRALPTTVTLEPWASMRHWEFSRKPEPERGMAVARLPSPLSGKRSRRLPGR